MRQRVAAVIDGPPPAALFALFDLVFHPAGLFFVALGSPSSSGSWRYHGISLEVEMTDMLIRDVPDDVIAAIDAHAGRLGLSRSQYVRRRLAQDAVSVQDLARFADVFSDLADPEVMSRAWQ
jgi:hypothetical protein